jgi:hypothetical protein
LLFERPGVRWRACKNGIDKEKALLDLIMIGLTVVFFTASLGYLKACDLL